MLLLGEHFAVGAAVDGHARKGQIVRQPFELPVDLLGQLARGGHHDAVYMVLRLGESVKQVDYRQKVGRGLARARLGHGYKVVTFEYLRNSLFLYGGTVMEAHLVEGVEDAVAQIKFVKSHYQRVFQNNC